MRIYVAQGRPGVLEMKYKHSIARRNPIKVKIVNGTSAITSEADLKNGRKRTRGVDDDGFEERLRLELKDYKGTRNWKRDGMDKGSRCRG
jgi:hypothetical protein